MKSHVGINGKWQREIGKHYECLFWVALGSERCCWLPFSFIMAFWEQRVGKVKKSVGFWLAGSLMIMTMTTTDDRSMNLEKKSAQHLRLAWDDMRH